MAIWNPKMDTSSGGRPASKPISGPFRRALRRARLTLRRCWQIISAPNDFLGIGVLLLLLLPFFVLLALGADLLAFLFGSVLRAIVSWSLLFTLLGLVLGLSIGGDAVLVMPVMAGVVGVLLGAVLGFLTGPIFRELPSHLDRKLLSQNEW